MAIDDSLPVVNEGKCCVECEFMSIQTGSPAYSEWTPGEDFTMSCSKEVWDFDPYGTEQEYRDCMLAARRCIHFKDRGPK